MEITTLDIRHEDGKSLHDSNYRLRDEPIKLNGVFTAVLNAPGTDSWEDEGGALPPGALVVEDLWRYMSSMRVRGGRKQTAARIARKKSIPVVKVEVKKSTFDYVTLLQEKK